MAYKLALPLTSRVHPVFHVSQLKRVQGPLPTIPTPLPDSLNGDLELEVLPVKLLGVRTTLHGDETNLEVLIQWQGLSEFEATWEQSALIQERFPSFHLEDKVRVWEGGNAIHPPRPPIRFTYSRRTKP